MRLRLYFGVIIIFSILSLASIVAADAPNMIQYQGRLTDDTGMPIDTIVDLTIVIYSDSTGQSKLWEENHVAVTISEGLFDILLGSLTVFGPGVFDGSERWLGIAVGGGDIMTPLTPIVSSAYAIKSQHAATASASEYADTAAFASETRHADTADVALNVSSNGWNDAGAIVRLETITDRVGIGVTTPYEKLEVDGNIALSQGSDIYFGNSSNRITSTASVPADILLYSQDDVWLNPVDDVQIRQGSDPVFARFDLGQRMLSLGTTTADEMLHVENVEAGGRAFIKLQTSHATDFGEVGFRIETPQNRWHFRMDDASNNNLPYGALSLRSQNLNEEVMVWDEDGNVGVGTTAPAYKLHVNGSAKVNYTFYAVNTDVSSLASSYNLSVTDDAVIGDTLFAGAFEADAIGKENIIDEIGIASTASSSSTALATTHTPYLTREITVPSAGYILALGWAHITLDHGISGVTWGGIVFSEMSDDSDGGMTATFSLGSNVEAGLHGCVVSSQRLFYAPAAGTYTYYMLGMRNPDNFASIGNRQMDLLFIPTSYSSKSGQIADIEDNLFHSTATDSRFEQPVNNESNSSGRPLDIKTLESKLNSLLTEAEEIKRELSTLKEH